MKKIYDLDYVMSAKGAKIQIWSAGHFDDKEKLETLETETAVYRYRLEDVNYNEHRKKAFEDFERRIKTMTDKEKFIDNNKEYLDRLAEDKSRKGCGDAPNTEQWKRIIENDVRDFDFEDKQEWDAIAYDWAIEYLKNAGAVKE